MEFKVIVHRKIWRCFNAIIRVQHTVKFCVSVWSLFWLKTNFDLVYFSLSHTTKTLVLNIKSIERISSSCSAEREAITYSENSAKPEVDFEPSWGEIVFCIFLPKKVVLAETKYGPFLFLLEPVYGRNKSEINILTCAINRRFRSVFVGTHS